MSFLLDALRKSELERKVGEIPKFNPELAYPGSQAKRGHEKILIGALVLINLGALVYIVWDSQASESTSSVSGLNQNSKTTQGVIRSEFWTYDGGNPKQVVSKPSPISTSIEKRNRDTPSVKPEQKITRPQMPVKPAVKPQNRSEAVKPLLASKEALAEPDSLQSGDAASASANDTHSVSATESLKTLEPPLQKATSNEAKKAGKKDYPLLSELPRDFQRELPTLNINVFVYSKVPEDRFVIVNMSRYVAGQKIDDGPQILEIRADSLALNYQGKNFRIQRP